MKIKNLIKKEPNYFSKKAMEFWDSVVYGEETQGEKNMFITREGTGEDIRFTVRAYVGKRFKDISKFKEFKTYKEAYDALTTELHKETKEKIQREAERNDKAKQRKPNKRAR